MTNKYVIFIGMGFELVGLILGSVYLGHMVDVNYPTQGLGVVSLSLLALAGWLVHVVALSRKLEKNEDSSK